MIVRELITKLGFSLNQSQLNTAERATERLKERANEASNTFRNIVLAIGSFATFKGLVNVADNMQSIRARIGMLPQTIGEAATSFDIVADHAIAAGIKLDAYAGLYTRLGNAAKEYIKTEGDLLQITDTISQALVVGGASAQEASSVMLQFAQALGSGVLQGDEFRAMAEAAPQYLDKLSETMGIPREQLKKMASEGKLTAKEVIAATQKMSAYFQEKFLQMPLTVGRATIMISNRFSKMVDRMNRESGFINFLASNMLSAFDRIEKAVFDLVKLFDGWENAVRLVGIAIAVAFGTKAIAILMAFRAAGIAAMLPFAKIIALITAVTLIVEDLYVWIQGGDSVVGHFLGSWEMFSREAVFLINKVIGELKALWYVMGIIGEDFIDWLDPKGIIDGLTRIGTFLSTMFTPVASAIENAFRTAFDSIGAWIGGVFKGFGDKLYNSFSDSIKESFDSIGGRLRSLFPGTVPPMTPQTVVSTPGVGGGSRVVNSNTTVNVTVPAGTSAEQASFLQNTATEVFTKESNDKLARQMSVYSD